MLDLVPSARVGHVGLYRDPKTLVPIEYYLKLPDRLDERLSIVVDPMLATGNSAAAAVQRIKDAGAKRIKFVCLLAAPEGLEAFYDQHPDVPIITAAVDRELNDHAYILVYACWCGDLFCYKHGAINHSSSLNTWARRKNKWLIQYTP